MKLHELGALRDAWLALVSGPVKVLIAFDPVRREYVVSAGPGKTYFLSPEEFQYVVRASAPAFQREAEVMK